MQQPQTTKKRASKKKASSAQPPQQAVTLQPQHDAANFGVASCCASSYESQSLILHLRVHPKQRALKTNTASATLHPPPTAATLQQHTYNDLLQYSPALHDDPIAYEKACSDSVPFALLDTPPASTTSATSDKASTTDVKGEHHNSDVAATAQATSDTSHSTPVTSVAATTAPRTQGTSVTCTDPTLEHGVCCWWCTHSFTWSPYALPVCRDVHDDTYQTVGAFCSPECCAAYLFDGSNRYGDPWKQYEMLHRMVHKLVEGTRVRIKLAPPRETLKKFGGPYSVEAYRQLLNDYRADVRITVPPIKPLQTVTEETPTDYTKPKKKFVPIDVSRVEKATNELRLKRKKKHSEENTLETFMRLRIS